jgi:hypothetical protein
MSSVFLPSTEVGFAGAAHHFRSLRDGDFMPAVQVEQADTPQQRPASLRAMADRNVMEMALYTFGDFRTAEEWMYTYHPHLKDEPATACQQPGGLRMVVGLLQAISHGTEP